MIRHNLPNSARAQCCWALANSYLSAATRLLKDPSGQAYMPILFLLGHALELHLKAFLALQGMTDNQLKRPNLRHNLIGCLRECRERGLFRYLSLSLRQVRQIARVNLYYQEKHLEYFTATAKRFGSIDEFQLIVEHVSKANFNPITDALFVRPQTLKPNLAPNAGP